MIDQSEAPPDVVDVASPAVGDDAITTDTLLRGRVTLLQPARGFRSSLDPVLLAGFVAPPFGRFVDIGCGTGAVAFLLAAADDGATGVGVEIQPRLASLAAAGLARNSFANRVQILEADVRDAVGCPPLGRAAFDLVVTNPPYRAMTGGVLSPNIERARANHELTLTLDDWLDCAAALVKPEGRIAVVYGADRMQALVTGLEHRRLQLTRTRLVHSRPDRPALRVLVEASGAGKAQAQAFVEAPLVLHGPDGTYTHEVRRMLGEW